MNHEDTLVSATASFERLVAVIAVAINLGPFIVDHRPSWAAGVVIAACASIAASHSQWNFRRCVQTPDRAALGHRYRFIATAMWFASIAAFGVGAI